ncbi:MAG: ATP-binding protein [Selenomonadaceae bacterium]|nr:ATP-binding protein [Selenomonadaceae bacterium]
MLVQFSVKNFRSFKKEAVLSMEASSDLDHIENVAEINNAHNTDRILKNVSIFGANAAGKSNLFKALTAAIITVRQSNSRQPGDILTMIDPFRFDVESSEEPSEFEFVFISEDTKYVYGFTATSQKIITEYLYMYKTSRPTTIFERENESYRFTVPSIRRELSPIIERNSENKLFLSTAAAWNSKTILVPFKWFLKIDTYRPITAGSLMPNVEGLLSDENNKELRFFIQDLLRKADINIADYRYTSKEVDMDEFIKQNPPLSMISKLLPPKQKRIDIKMIHNIINDEGEEKSGELDFNDESAGTQNLFLFSPLLLKAFKEGSILCIDEFDASLHPLLLIQLIAFFNDPEINKANAQLIISTHATELLTDKIQRRDQIYFMQKNNKTGESELYSLDEFSKHGNKDIRKAYLIGRYGAIPNIR